MGKLENIGEKIKPMLAIYNENLTRLYPLSLPIVYTSMKISQTIIQPLYKNTNILLSLPEWHLICGIPQLEGWMARGYNVTLYYFNIYIISHSIT